jgi:hypothetical protein
MEVKQMITLTAKINLLSGDNKALSLGSDDLSGNNISSDLSNIIGVKTQGSNPFIIGVSKLGDGSTFSSGVDYFIGEQLSDKNGNFLSPYTITINDKKSFITSITISFDTTNGRHPKRIIIDGTQYEDDDAIFTIIGLTAQSTHTIYIDNWNNPTYPLIITGIYAELSIDIDRRNLISISRSIFDRSDLKLPSFGIISNTGNIEFNDTDGEIRDYAEQLLLQSGLSCEIKLNNTLVENASDTIGLFETDEWNYDNDNRVVSVSIKDDLEEWQDINVEGISYDPRVIEHKPFKWLYEHLWTITTANGNYNMLAFDELDTDTQDILNYTYTRYPLLESCSLWTAWEKVCEVCQLHIYKNNDGVIVCRYNGGN